MGVSHFDKVLDDRTDGARDKPNGPNMVLRW